MHRIGNIYSHMMIPIQGQQILTWCHMGNVMNRSRLRYLSLSKCYHQDSDQIEIGGIVKPIEKAKNTELVPSNYCKSMHCITSSLVLTLIVRFHSSECRT